MKKVNGFKISGRDKKAKKIMDLFFYDEDYDKIPMIYIWNSVATFVENIKKKR